MGAAIFFFYFDIRTDFPLPVQKWLFFIYIIHSFNEQTLKSYHIPTTFSLWLAHSSVDNMDYHKFSTGPPYGAVITTMYTPPYPIPLSYVPRGCCMCSLHSVSDVLSVSLPYMAYHFATWIHHRSGVRGIRSLLPPTIVHLVRSVNAAKKDVLWLALFS